LTAGALELLPSIFLEGEPCAEQHRMIRDKFIQMKTAMEIFKQRFFEEVQPFLMSYNTAWQKTRRNIQVGDIVAVLEKSLDRPAEEYGSAEDEKGLWPLARVMRVYPGSDGLIRNVQIMVNGKLYDRNIRKLMLIEAVDKNKLFNLENTSDTEEEVLLSPEQAPKSSENVLEEDGSNVVP
jgi:hypothetical protein